MLGEYHLFEMFSHGLNVTEIMKLGDEAVVELLEGGAPDLMNDNGSQFSNIGFDRTLIDVDLFRLFAIPGSGLGISPYGGQGKAEKVWEELARDEFPRGPLASAKWD